MSFINNNTFASYLHFQGRGTTFSSKSSRKYVLIPAIEVIWYDPSQLGPNSPQARFFVVPKTFLNSKSLGANGLNLTFESYPCLSFC